VSQSKRDSLADAAQLALVSGDHYEPACNPALRAGDEGAEASRFMAERATFFAGAFGTMAAAHAFQACRELRA
jgi:hypothetical protein